MSETPIEDKSVLGVHGQKMCENIDVHWLTPATSGQSVLAPNACDIVRLKPELIVSRPGLRPLNSLPLLDVLLLERLVLVLTWIGGLGYEHGHRDLKCNVANGSLRLFIFVKVNRCCRLLLVTNV